MLNKNNNTAEGLEIIAVNEKELNKNQFFNMLSNAPEGIELTIDRIGNLYKSKYADNKGNYPSGCFIDYSFSINETNYKVGISYNLGLPVAEETFILTSGMNIFKILEIATDLSKAKKIKVTKTFINESLTGVKFLAKVGAGYNGFIIKPVELIL